MLVEAGSDVNVADEEGNSALMQVLQESPADLVTALLSEVLTPMLPIT